MISQLEAPVGGVKPTSGLQTLANNLASGLMRGKEELAVNESKSPLPTLLEWAVKERIDTLIEILVAMKGAVITANSLRSPRVLHDAVPGDHHQKTWILVLSRHGMHADTSLRERGYTALQKVAEEGNLSAICALLEAGADVNAPPATDDGRTALQVAAGGGHHAALDMLLKAGAEVNAPPSRSTGRTALQAAAGGGHHVALDILLKAGAD